MPNANDLHIAHPERLWLLWTLPFVILFFVYAWQYKHTLLQRFANLAALQRLGITTHKKRFIIKRALLVIAIACALLSLAAIQYGSMWQATEANGIDVVIAVDVSDSMLVEDDPSQDKTSRLLRAKRKIADLMQRMHGDRIGLVAFAGDAFLLCPLTMDYQAAAIFLDDLDPDIISIKGTSLPRAIDVSLQALAHASESNADNRAILLITDGENLQDDVLQSAHHAAQQGVMIYTIGIGTPDGAPIPDANGGFHHDASGNLVISKLDETTLQEIAHITHGKYMRWSLTDLDLDALYNTGIKNISPHASPDKTNHQKQYWHDRYQWFIGLCVICLLIESLLTDNKTKKT